MSVSRTETATGVAFDNPTGLPVVTWKFLFTASVNTANSQEIDQPAAPVGAQATCTAVLQPDSYTITVQAFDGNTPPAPVGPAVTDPASPVVIAAVQAVTVSIPGTITGA
jgi:hypothetical protein